MKRIVFTVTNDLSYDQRMQRICSALANHGYECLLVGRVLPNSLALAEFPFEQKRLRCFLTKGFGFYAEYNLRLFFFLLFQRFDVICSIDLDTILPGYFVSRLRSKTQVYDAHEYFSQMEEVVTRPWVHRVWLTIEQSMMTRIQHVYTIGKGYARIFKKKYNLEAEVIRNVPFKLDDRYVSKGQGKGLIYQGAVNVGRGLDEAMEAAVHLPTHLHIYGAGPELDRLKQKNASANNKANTIFHGPLLPAELRKTTAKHGIGLTLFSTIGEHHQLSLANRFFDYIQSGVPQIAMNYAEYARINKEFEVAILIDELTPAAIQSAAEKLLNDHDLYQRLATNCLSARKELCWEKEAEKLLHFYNQLP